MAKKVTYFQPACYTKWLYIDYVINSYTGWKNNNNNNNNNTSSKLVL